jgi:hypothetical protein
MIQRSRHLLSIACCAPYIYNSAKLVDEEAEGTRAVSSQQQRA